MGYIAKALIFAVQLYMPDDNTKTSGKKSGSATAGTSVTTAPKGPNTTPTNVGVTVADQPPATSEDLLIPPSDVFSSEPGVSSGPRKGSAQKTIATILGIVLLVAGVAAGVYLVNQQTQVTTKAWDCKNYVFELSEEGVITVRNGSTRNEPLQSVTVNINGNTIATLDVPALEAGDAATLGNVSVPDDGFAWEMKGSKDCENSGKYGPEEKPTPSIPQVTGQCQSVVAYDSTWNKLTNAELSSLSAGDMVRFTISGSATSGTFDRAKFNINGTQRPEVTDKKPGSEEFYDEYEIPAGVSSFDVQAEVHHSGLGWF